MGTIYSSSFDSDFGQNLVRMTIFIRSKRENMELQRCHS